MRRNRKDFVDRMFDSDSLMNTYIVNRFSNKYEILTKKKTTRHARTDFIYICRACINKNEKEKIRK